jgi:hypothetical protein
MTVTPRPGQLPRPSRAEAPVPRRRQEAPGAADGQPEPGGGSPEHLGRCSVPVRPRRRPARSRRRDASRPACAAARAHRELPGDARRRQRRRLHRPSCPAQREPRSGQGRNPLPPGRDPGRGPCPGDVDDLEVCLREHPLWRREGRRGGRPEATEPAGGRGADATLHHGDQPAHRPRARHPRAGREHERADDGLDHGHVLDAPRLHDPRRRHRQAGQHRRLPRPKRGDRPGGRLHAAAVGGSDEPIHRGHDGRHPGLRQRRLDRGHPAGRGGGADRRP